MPPSLNAITSAPVMLTVDEILLQAIEHQRAGRLPDAEQLYRAILQVQPQHPDAHHNLGILAVGLKQPQAALSHLKIALEASPQVGQYWFSYISALIDSEQSITARQVLDEAKRRGLDDGAVQQLEQRLANQVLDGRRLPPKSKKDKAKARVGPAAQMNEALVLYSRGEHNLALTKARALLRRSPNHAVAWRVASAACWALKQFDEALAAAKRALALAPKDVEAWSVLGVVYRALRRYPEALYAYRKALDLDGGHVQTLVNFGNVLNELGRHDEALAMCKLALEKVPSDVVALRGLSAALLGTIRYGEAEAAARQGITLEPKDAAAHANLAAALAGQDRHEEAESVARRSIALDPTSAVAHANRAAALKELCRGEEAIASYQRAAELDPEKAIEFHIQEALLVPKLVASREEIATWRQRFAGGIETLFAETFEIPPERLYKCQPSFFELAYHDADNRPLMESLCRLFRAKAPPLTFTAAHVATWQKTQGARIRLGLCSHGFYSHSVGKLLQGILRHLDRQRFEVILFHAQEAPRDDFSAMLDDLVDKAIRLPPGLLEQQRLIAQERLDVLFYPNSQERPSTHFLAHARLAPVQFASWGIADTTGLDSIDYFLSAAHIEPLGADAHYSERLICLNRLPCYYQPPAAPLQIPTRGVFGLPEAGTLYGCPQSLFKFHPDFDAVLAEIAAGDPDGHIVLIEGKVATWTQLLRQRWANSAPILNERVVFLPQQPAEKFMLQMAHYDVLLDPIHFGSGNTLYEAMVYGTPIVTWPGRFMRGRIVSGAYRQMGVADAPIAGRLEDYAPLALALGRDAARRLALRQECLAAGVKRLFSDLGAVREFETFIEAAVEAAGRGEKLVAGWRPPQWQEVNE